MDVSNAETQVPPTNVEEAYDGTQSGLLKQNESPLLLNHRMNDLLLEIAPNIGHAFQKIKLYFKDDLSGMLYSDSKEVEHLFVILCQRRYITPDNLIHLQKIVMMIDDRGTREKLMERIYKFAMSERDIYFRENTEKPAVGFKQAKYQINETKSVHMTVSDIKDLQLKVAELLGLTQDEVLIDGIEKSNSLYVSLLIPERYFELHQILARTGLPSLSDFGVETISIGGRGFKVSNGEEVQELPLVYKTRDEELVALQKHRDTLLEENLSLKKEKADLKLKFEGLTDDSVEDIDSLSQKFDKSLQMAYSNGVDRIVISPLVNESLRLGREIGKKHQTLKLDQLEADLAYYRLLHNMTDQETAIKDSVMKQLKILFETGGQSIDETEGYKPRLIKGAIEISEKLSDEEFEKLKSDKETMMQFDRLFVLHLYHEENKRSQTFIRLEKFMQDCLEKLHRRDLAKTWQKYLKPSPDEDPLQKLLKTMEQTLEDLQPGVGLDVEDLLRKTCSRLTKDEKMALKSKLPKEIEVKDDDSVLGLLLLVRDMSSPGRNDLGQLTEFVEKMLDLVGRKDIMEFFMKEMNRLKMSSGIKEEIKELLHKTCSKLTADEKLMLRAKLKTKVEVENEDDVLIHLLLERKELGPDITTLAQLIEFVKEILILVEREDILKYFLEETQKLAQKTLVPQPQTLLSLLRQQGEKLQSLLKENESEKSDTATKSEGLNPEVPLPGTLLSLLRQQGEKMQSLLKENESENSDTATKSEGLNPAGIQDLKKFINGETDKIIKCIDANKHSPNVYKFHGENFNFGTSGTIVSN